MESKGSTYKIAAGVTWAICVGFFAFGTLQISGPQAAAIEKIRLDVQESQEKLIFAQSTKKGEMLQRMQDRLDAAQGSVMTFTCSAAEESSLIFQIGQLARMVELKKFVSHSPDHTRENTLEKSNYIAEGWLNIEFVADYLKLTAFVNGLERQTPVLFIESMNIKQSDDGSDEAVVHMSLSYLIRKDSTANEAACVAAVR